ncbi:MAG TPA: CoA transferase [Steroidobacteraceae bacterium]|nr:CoA transferase [Steroidobacteraceae bacterium]
MKALAEHRALTLGDTDGGAIARFLASLGVQLSPTSPEHLLTDLEGASFLIDRWTAAEWAASAMPLSAEDLEARYPRLIHLCVTPFGRQGPRSDWRAGELVVSALGGSLILTGDPDRAPVKEALDACLFHADMVAAAAALAAHYERGISGRGQRIDISVQHVAFSRGVNPLLVWQFDHRKLHRAGGALSYGRATVRCIWRLRDGWCFHTLMTGQLGAPANQALSDWMDAKGMENPLQGTDWARYNRSTLDPSLRLRWEAAIEAFFRSCSKSEIATEGRRRGINAAVVQEPADALADPHLHARAFWAEEQGIRVPGRFFQVREGEAAEARPGARHGQRPGPLTGVRVLDFSWALVGSITTKTLGDLGAEVIKIESRARPCLSRLDRQVEVSRTHSLDDKPWFAHLNTSKRSLALDLKRTQSREILEPLVRWADIVVENFSPGTMRKLGLDYESLARLNPSIVMVSGSVYGQSGPLSREWGVDGTGAALSGRTFLTGWPDRDPVIPGAVPYGDVVVPYVMAAAACAALQRRRESGRGGHIDVAMYEVCLQQTYDALLQAQTGRPPSRAGNLDPRSYHQGVYPVNGADRWIAICCPQPQHWSRLARLAGLGAGAPASLEAQLAAWTATQDVARLAEQLQCAGIEAGEAQDISALMERDPALAAREPLLTLEHPLLGPFGHLVTPMHFSRSVCRPFRAPSLGEHSRAIAVEVAGLTPARVDELMKDGVLE